MFSKVKFSCQRKPLCVDLSSSMPRIGSGSCWSVVQSLPNAGFVSWFGAQPCLCVCVSSVASFSLPEHVVVTATF